MEVQVVASLIGIVGITLSAIFSGFGYFFKIRTEKLRTTRQVLFYLLEFRAYVLASSVSPTELYEKYLEQCQKYLDKKKIEGIAIPQQNQDLMLGYFSNVIEQITPKLSESFIIEYEQTIISLSKENPILAFQLRGKDMATKLVSLQRVYLEQLQQSEIFTSNESLGGFLKSQITEVHSKGLNEILDLLNQELRTVSKACGFIHYLQIRKITNNRSKPSSDLDDIGIDELFDGLLSAYSHHVKLENTHTGNNG
ncbi:hypothetical protein KVQ40_003404 [Vibrio cholerae]|nr:hypothetical protein [Vibrio cholerae]